MFSVIFEVFPKKENFNQYLALARELKPLLEKTDGFVDNERFESIRREGWILSHSTWRDEKSVVRWRTTGEHHMIQEQGRDHVLNDYHLRVGDVTYDTNEPAEAPVKEQRFDETQTGVAKLMTFTEIIPVKGADLKNDLPSRVGFNLQPGIAIEYDVFASIYNPGKFALLISWTDTNAGSRWAPEKGKDIQDIRHRKIRIVRDYGMFDRRESPQYYPDAKGHETLHAEQKK